MRPAAPRERIRTPSPPVLPRGQRLGRPQARRREAESLGRGRAVVVEAEADQVRARHVELARQVQVPALLADQPRLPGETTHRVASDRLLVADREERVERDPDELAVRRLVNEPPCNVPLFLMLASGVGLRQTSRNLGLGLRCTELKFRKVAPHARR